MTGTSITVTAAGGSEFSAYLALPESGTSPGIVLCQEIFGVNSHMREVADLYSAEGYVVMVSDLFWRLQPGIALTDGSADFERAIALLQRFDVSTGISDISATVKELRRHPGCNGKVGVVGFCLGGKLAYLAASMVNVDAAVGYYGARPADRPCDGLLAAPPTALPHIQAGKLRPLATTGLTRPAYMPDVPTVAASGFPGFEALRGDTEGAERSRDQGPAHEARSHATPHDACQSDRIHAQGVGTMGQHRPRTQDHR